ncbi:MAG: radical SAM protein [Candidatus Omnitrophota bacterium]
MKIMISFPPIPDAKGTPMLGQNRQFQYFHNPSYIYPMVPASAASLLSREGFEVIWNDCIAQQRTYEQFLEGFKKEKPDIIAMETKTPVVRKHWRIIEDLKKIYPACKVVLMGDHVTALPQESMLNSKADYIITGGDYDFLLLNIVRQLSGKTELEQGIYYREKDEIKNTGSFELNHDLNSLPYIDRELTQWNLYGEKLYKGTPFTYTMAGRDCFWAKCKFCSWTTLYPRFRVVSVERFLDEVGILINKYGVKEIFDDTGTFPGGKWLEKFCNGMIERGYNKKIYFSCNFRFDCLTLERAKLMKKAGFRLLKLGLESANSDTLKRIDKGSTVEDIIKGCKITKNAGLTVHLTMMVGYPWENKEAATRTFNLAKNLMTNGYAAMLQSTVVIPYQGTPFYREAVENNWFAVSPGDYEKFDMSAPVLNTPDMSADEIMKLCDSIYKVFLHPKFVMHHLLKIRSFEDIAYLFRGVKPVLGHIKDFMRISK